LKKLPDLLTIENMEITGAPLGIQSSPCPYLDGLIFESETVYMQSYDPEGLDYLLSLGFRHFSRYFFRPVCSDCHRCIPLRVPVEQFRFTRNRRRLLRRNSAFDVALEEPKPESRMFDLYRLHAERFSLGGNEDYETFRDSFFTPLPGARMLTVRDGSRLVAVSHIDFTDTAMSAVYCYWDPDYAEASPGKFAILKELEIAREHGVRHLYLGYYVRENRHMSYKKRYRPNEALLSEGHWVPFVDGDGTVTGPEVEQHGFQPVLRITGASAAGSPS
jgi:arginine-tRNA-protein transferase